MNWKQLAYHDLLKHGLEHWLPSLIPQLDNWENSERHGDAKKWEKQLTQLPSFDNYSVDLSKGVSLLLNDHDISDSHKAHVESVLKQFMPWRKGPFHFFGIDIDTEWRSDWKWERVLPFVDDLKGKKVLDVGCGSGYHLFRMLGLESSLAIGIDPTDLFFYQFSIFKRYLNNKPIHFLPIGIEDMPQTQSFDTVFSMGVLYHRRDPIEFLYQLKNQLARGGQLVLETIVIDGDINTVLMPGERYAQMRNVWFIPSCAALQQWLARVGFKDIKLVDLSTTTIEEQRATEWMTNHSLVDFLSPTDPTKTIEGYPAPKRAVITAKVK
ncbi:tRNA 5-methoxyuridine(34)/uridine 5-oxyacetic acid(34) synthase CmoB [Glaciecola sp. MH2013]|uniref:tRNA 5-methoxyuridine(34)/uridine 5-oxyacetic acid(34) synthase CmoB n=1 Tax=Glaciecola sp. MH2013 TaxID=2785524 RepID=UPI0018A0CD79|nr:tRNA 5-methoxyuridine(34)/uridine 5-oxyacetic acid(34) synthase CmoB [Glaciecola sp. MH2013]MBF7072890.1 tRNA 5-methoxyuridine(34)/uridine 5-oxyacetic acid(34) synthase CmoB [Glaciecola sp. MH2013]